MTRLRAKTHILPARCILGLKVTNRTAVSRASEIHAEDGDLGERFPPPWQGWANPRASGPQGRGTRDRADAGARDFSGRSPGLSSGMGFGVVEGSALRPHSLDAKEPGLDPGVRLLSPQAFH
ncbi:unnamed protein product [Rangifer tarandus platyrhynchus]|uniref:Uncharacterized protein n=2 Tax=Rangifer tarandus platyrhynchus TaxID=3082113 RepID=A0ACB0E656_RANTA|nr:unnamed protein product [Rangifer tarandus platyrhynchus]CAI9696115.1 unnamed protein product [Rangifer tarandus platyrhynchus]